MGIRTGNSIRILRQTKTSVVTTNTVAANVPAHTYAAISRRSKLPYSPIPRGSIFVNKRGLEDVIEAGFDKQSYQKLPPLKTSRKYPGLKEELLAMLPDAGPSDGITQSQWLPTWLSRLVPTNSVELSINLDQPNGTATIRFWKQNESSTLRALEFQLNLSTGQGEFTRVTNDGFCMFLRAMEEWGFRVSKDIY